MRRIAWSYGHIESQTIISGADDRSPTPEFSDSDQAWFDALTGQPTPNTTSAAVREGRALRAALEQRRHEMASNPELDAAISDEALRRQLQRVRERARDEGLFDGAARVAPTQSAEPSASSTPLPRKNNVVEFPWWRRRKVLVGLAASLMMAVLVIQQLGTRPDYPPPNEMLGADGLQRLTSPMPKQAAEQLADQLRQAGLRPGVYQRGKAYIVDITLLASELRLAEPAFMSLEAKPAAGFNRVEFVAP